MPSFRCLARTRLALLALSLFSVPIFATEYPLRPDGGGIFGQPRSVTTRYEDTLLDIARANSLGYEEITRVNPGVDPWLPGAGKDIVLPSQRVLPPGPREGIVVNLPEHRLYFYPKPKAGQPSLVMTFPVSIGKMDWRTPLGTTHIADKRRNPAWYPPKSVRDEHAARGDPLPAVVPAGPDNPLGAFAMRLDLRGGAYMIHGTNNPAAVGMAVTHGCIRMYPEDIEKLFPLVPVGTPVTLIDEPIKIAWVDGELWLEVHPPVNGEGQTIEPDMDDFSKRLDAVLGRQQAAIYWDYATTVLRQARGIPSVVGLEAFMSADEAPVEIRALDAPESSADPAAP
jgi:L,D-transpeptidase ErfK/SrfK